MTRNEILKNDIYKEENVILSTNQSIRAYIGTRIPNRTHIEYADTTVSEIEPLSLS
jgi:hypothetical protein